MTRQYYKLLINPLALLYSSPQSRETISLQLITKTYLAKFRKKLSSGKKVSSLRKIAELIQKQNCTVNKSVEHIQEENWHIQDIYLAHSEMK